MFLTAEITGLPSGGKYLAQLETPRLAFQKHFLGRMPGRKGYERFDRAVPITITGSLFYDVAHHAGRVGPSWARPKTSWEILPVTKIEFGR